MCKGKWGGGETYHCGPPSASRRVTVDAVLSAPLRHLLIVTIHDLHISRADQLLASRPKQAQGTRKQTQRRSVLLAADKINTGGNTAGMVLIRCLAPRAKCTDERQFHPTCFPSVEDARRKQFKAQHFLLQTKYSSPGLVETGSL